MYLLWDSVHWLFYFLDSITHSPVGEFTVDGKSCEWSNTDDVVKNEFYKTSAKQTKDNFGFGGAMAWLLDGISTKLGSTVATDDLVRDHP